MRPILTLILALFASLAQAQTVVTVTAPTACTQLVCAPVQNDQGANISVSFPSSVDFSLSVSVNGVTTVYPQGTYTLAPNAIVNSYWSYPVITYPGGVLSFAMRRGMSGTPNGRHSVCPSCASLTLNSGSLSY